jgi:Ca2+-binding EF-hand superfamily protein
MATSSTGITSAGMLQTLQQLNSASAFRTDEAKATRKKLQGGTNGTEGSSLAKLFAVVDSDGDGKLSKAELSKTELSQTLSQDLSKSEVSSVLDMLRARSDLLKVQEASQETQPGQPPSVADLVTAADSDGDGALSLAEIKANLAGDTPAGAGDLGTTEDEKRFSRFDTNKDGVVSQSELAAAFGSQGAATPASASASSSPGLLGLLMQAASAYSSTATSTDSANSASLLGSLVKAA